MTLPQFRVDLQDMDRTLFDLERIMQYVRERFDVPTTRPSNPAVGAIRWDNTGSALEVFDGTDWQVLGTGGSDFKVKVTSDDTTGNFLFGKLAVGANITLTETNPAGDEDVTIAVDSGVLLVNVKDDGSALLAASNISNLVRLDDITYPNPPPDDADAPTKVTIIGTSYGSWNVT